MEVLSGSGVKKPLCQKCGKEILAPKLPLAAIMHALKKKKKRFSLPEAQQSPAGQGAMFGTEHLATFNLTLSGANVSP